MQAVILAAGMGKRLKELTQNNTKCMVKVNGVTLIERMLRQLERCALSKIIIVVGYEREKLIEFIGTLNIKTPIVYVENDIYYKTNNIYSLALAKNYLLREDTILLESDLIFEDSILRELIDDPRDTLAVVDKYESWMDGTCIKIGADDSIDAFIPGKKFAFDDIPDYYKTVNIYKFSKHFSVTHYVPFLDAYSKALGNNEYYEQVLRVIVMLDDPEIKAKKLTGQLWYEIDDVQDLDIASSMFIDDEDKRVELISARYGGFWRYPKLKDFCYLVNPYYPPQKLVDEIKANFETLLTQYPSGMAVNSLLASKDFNVRREHIVVGNGAAELIKCLMENGMGGGIGFIRPTFEEYPNRYSKEKSVAFVPQNSDYSYTADDLKAYFSDKEITALVVVNPDNPSGNYLGHADVLSLAQWAKERKITLVVDESFVDFSDEEGATLLSEEVLKRYPNLIVVKSISKSYGVPGLRLGVLASADEALIEGLKKSVAIWNINSFGEFYMQIAEKYKGDYALSLKKIRAARSKFYEGLKKISGLRALPSQANYFMIELTGGVSARELTKLLLVKHNLLIKDLSKKTNGKQWVRIAVRDERDNALMLRALREILGER